MRNYLAPLALSAIAACIPVDLGNERIGGARQQDDENLAQALTVVNEVKARLIEEILGEHEGLHVGPSSNGSRMSATRCKISENFEAAKQQAYDDARRDVERWFSEQSPGQSPRFSNMTSTHQPSSSSGAIACAQVWGSDPLPLVSTSHSPHGDTIAE